MQVLAQVEESGKLLHFAVSSFYTCTVSRYSNVQIQRYRIKDNVSLGITHI